MSRTTDIGLFIIGVLALISMNAITFVFDAEWINATMVMDATFIGALIVKFLNSKK